MANLFKNNVAICLINSIKQKFSEFTLINEEMEVNLGGYLPKFDILEKIQDMKTIASSYCAIQPDCDMSIIPKLYSDTFELLRFYSDL